MNRKLFALVAATFLVTAALSGGTTVAILSDGATVTTTISVGNTAAGNTAAGNAPVKVSANVDDPDDRATDSSSGEEDQAIQAESSGTGDGTGTGEGISIVLEPADGEEVEKGKTTTYNVVVEGADDDIGAYDLTVELSDSSDATFTDVTYVPSDDSQPKIVEGDSGISHVKEVRMWASMSSDLESPEEEGIVIATVTVEGTVSEKADLTVADGARILKGGSSAESYDVTERVTVTDS